MTGAASDAESPRRVVYLLGAGATQGVATFGGSVEKLVMAGLIGRLIARMREEYVHAFHPHPGMDRLVNDVVDEDVDFEHLLTFLEDTPSGRYQEFARRLKGVFSSVLRSRLANVRLELGDEHSALYAALIDMHGVDGSREALGGFLTLNYDSFLEHAIETRLERSVDYGVSVNGKRASGDGAIPVLKLHGSFSWRHAWPIEVGSESGPGLWIPPGIRKAKADYPFNAIWGAARQLLDCDVLRIIGCNLGPNDWDLVSLLFTTMHARESGPPYDVEVIAWPEDALSIGRLFPYLRVKSLFALSEIGPQLVGEVLGRRPTPFEDLDELEQVAAVQNAKAQIPNPFERWLRIKGELMVQDSLSLQTRHGFFEDFVEASP